MPRLQDSSTDYYDPMTDERIDAYGTMRQEQVNNVNYSYREAPPPSLPSPVIPPYYHECHLHQSHHYHHPQPHPEYQPQYSPNNFQYYHTASNANCFHPIQPTRKVSPSLIYDVRGEDVLCGRGAPSNFHPGNQYFRELISSNQVSYLASRRIDKPEISLAIVGKIKARGGRFLKRTKIPGGISGHFCWEDLGEQRAYEKTCQALREGGPEIRRSLAIKEPTQSTPDCADASNSSRDDNSTVRGNSWQQQTM